MGRGSAAVGLRDNLKRRCQRQRWEPQRREDRRSGGVLEGKRTQRCCTLFASVSEGANGDATGKAGSDVGGRSVRGRVQHSRPTAATQCTQDRMCRRVHSAAASQSAGAGGCLRAPDWTRSAAGRAVGGERAAAVAVAVAVGDAGAGGLQRPCRKHCTRRIGCTLSSIGRRKTGERVFVCVCVCVCVRGRVKADVGHYRRGVVDVEE